MPFFATPSSGSGGVSLPYPEVAKGDGNNWNALAVDSVGKMITDRLASHGTTLRLFLPRIADVIDAGGSIMFRACRLYASGGFGIYPHYDDINNSYGRHVSSGAELAQMALYALEAGSSMVLTPRVVNQVQLVVSGVTGTFAVGDVVTDGANGATGVIIYSGPDGDSGRTYLQLRNVTGEFGGENPILSNSGGAAGIYYNPVSCQYMWEADLMTGGFADLDNGWWNSVW